MSYPPAFSTFFSCCVLANCICDGVLMPRGLIGAVLFLSFDRGVPGLDPHADMAGVCEAFSFSMFLFSARL